MVPERRPIFGEIPGDSAEEEEEHFEGQQKEEDFITSFLSSPSPDLAHRSGTPPPLGAILTDTDPFNTTSITPTSGSTSSFPSSTLSSSNPADLRDIDSTTLDRITGNNDPLSNTTSSSTSSLVTLSSLSSATRRSSVPIISPPSFTLPLFSDSRPQQRSWGNRCALTSSWLFVPLIHAAREYRDRVLENQAPSCTPLPFEPQAYIPGSIWNILVTQYALNFQVRQIDFSSFRSLDYIPPDSQEQLLDDSSVDSYTKELLGLCTFIVRDRRHSTPQEVIAAFNRHGLLGHFSGLEPQQQLFPPPHQQIAQARLPMMNLQQRPLAQRVEYQLTREEAFAQGVQQQQRKRNIKLPDHEGKRGSKKRRNSMETEAAAAVITPEMFKKEFKLELSNEASDSQKCEFVCKYLQITYKLEQEEAKKIACHIGAIADQYGFRCDNKYQNKKNKTTTIYTKRKDEQEKVWYRLFFYIKVQSGQVEAYYEFNPKTPKKCVS